MYLAVNVVIPKNNYITKDLSLDAEQIFGNNFEFYDDLTDKIGSFYDNIQESGPRSDTSYGMFINELELYHTNGSLKYALENSFLRSYLHDQEDCLKDTKKQNIVVENNNEEEHSVTEECKPNLKIKKKNDLMCHLDGMPIVLKNIGGSFTAEAKKNFNFSFKTWLQVHMMFAITNIEYITAAIIIILQTIYGGFFNLFILGI